MKIIAATDLSPNAANAARTAARLARRLGDSLLLVRVIEPPMEVYPELRGPECAAFENALRQNNEALMSKAVLALRDEGIAVEGKVLGGQPARELAALAAAEGARMIVMGAHGQGAFSGLLFGSVAERTVRTAGCPVLVVPEQAAPFHHWSADRPLRLLVGYDSDGAGDAVLAAVEVLRGCGACDTTVLHTYWPPAEYARLGLQGPRDPFATDPEVVALIARDLRARAPQLTEGPHTRLCIEAGWGPLGVTLDQQAQAEQADVVVVGTRQLHGGERLRRGSSVLGVLRNTRRAVLCVPAPAAPAAAQVAVPALKTILVATDLSALANAAVAHAYSLLRGTGGAVELCHVHERHLPVPVYAYRDDRERLSPEARSKLEASLRALVPPEAERLGITSHVTVVDGGTAATAILQAARRLGADAITLASHGRTGLARGLFGSVAEAVIRGADRPVFVVRPQGGA
jgi:nucleotide-binding universal stress UspA family protein